MATEAAVYSAIAAKLSSDATLLGFMPDGVFRDVTPAGATRAVIISFQADSRVYGLEKRLAYEDVTYLVKAVHKHVSATTANQASARIFTLLQDAALTITGGTLMRIHQSEDNGRVEYVEVDPDDGDARWQHRGWLFDVMVSPT